MSPKLVPKLINACTYWNLVFKMAIGTRNQRLSQKDGLNIMSIKNDRF